MKKSLKYPRFLNRVLLLTAFLAVATLWSRPAKAEMPIGVSFQVFYDELMPYGTWVNDPQFGFVWIPNAGPQFHPYATNGHWVMTSYGNTWVSDFSWGWAPFHYGRWYFSNHYGWSWVPGYEWGPAWVNWRTGGGYYGWAPLGPGMYFNMAVSIPYHQYVFVPQGRLINRRLHRHFLPRNRVGIVYNNTTIIQNTVVYDQRTYIAGPSRGELQRASRRNVPVHQISNAGRPGRASVGRGTVAMYRPEVNSNSVRQARPSRAVAPSEFDRNATRAAARPANHRGNASAGNVQRSNNNRGREQVSGREATAPQRVATQPSRQNQRQVQQQPTQSQRQAAPRQQVNRQQGNAPSSVAEQPSRQNQRQVQQRPEQPQTRQAAPRQQVNRQQDNAPSRVATQPSQQNQRQVQQRPAQTQTRQAPRQQVNRQQGNTSPSVATQPSRQNQRQVQQSRQQAPARVQSAPPSRGSAGTVQSGQRSSGRSSEGSRTSSRGNNRRGNN